jgi:AcrR family transcriptional regulator
LDSVNGRASEGTLSALGPDRQLLFTNGMARPRQHRDGALLDGAERALVKHGPAGFTLRSAADEAAVSAATFVKRFGSRQRLLVALSQRWIDGLPHRMGSAAAAHPPGAAQVLAVAIDGFEQFDDPRSAAPHLVALAGDLADPELRALLARGWRVCKDGLASAVAAAHSRDELAASPDPERAARVLHSLANGAFLDWSVAPHGRLADRLAEDLSPLLAAWNTKENACE